MTSKWQQSTVGDQFDVQLGKMLDAAKNVGEPKPYLGNRAVQWGQIDTSAAGIVGLTQNERVRYRLRRGDLLVCEGGEVGRSAIWQDELSECYFQKALHRLRPKAGYDVRLMLALLEHWSYTGVFADYVTQTSIAHLPREKLIRMPLPVPPAPEQRRIGDALQNVDSLISKTEDLIEKKQAIRRGLMQQLLTGKARLPGYSQPWRRQPLPALMDRINAKKYQVLASSYSNDGRLPVVDQGQKRIVGYTDALTSGFDPGPNGVVVFGDHTCVTKFVDFPFAVGAEGVQIVRAKSARDSTRFLAYALELDPVSSTGYNRHFKALQEKALPAPVRAEQDAIAAILNDTDREVGGLHVRLDKIRDIKTGMMQQLLTGRTRLTTQFT